MCRSAADGGQRCAAHTRPAFQRALTTAHQPGHEAAFDAAAIEHATTRQGRSEVEALLAFATEPRTRLRIENLLAQADQLRARRSAVTAEVTQRLQAHRGTGGRGAEGGGAGGRRTGGAGHTGTPAHPADTADQPTHLRLIHTATEVPCDTCNGTGLDYDEYWGCDDCGGTGVEPADTATAQ